MLDRSRNSDLTVREYTELAERYSQIANQRESYLHAVNDHFLSVAKNEGPNWLDIGSGNGARTLLLNENLKKRLSIIEPSGLLPKTFEKSNPEVHVIRRRVEDAVFERTFDIVTMFWNVIGHLESLEECLRFIGYSLRSNGLLYFDANSALNVRRFGVANVARNLLHSRSVRYPWPNAESDTVVEIYRKSFVVHFLKKAGFQVEIRYLDYDRGDWVQNEFQGSFIILARKLL